MTKLAWDNPGERLYETGIDRGVLYIQGSGMAWNGLISISETPNGGKAEAVHLDGVKVANEASIENLGFTLQAFTYPDEFEACDGTSETNGISFGEQPRVPFDMTCRTMLGNDTVGTDLGYQIHIYYGCYAAPSAQSFESLDDSPQAVPFAWNVSTATDQCLPGFRSSTHLVFDSRNAPRPELITDLENMLYGTSTTPPTLPSLEDLAFWFQDWWLVRITDNGDGTWTATGPDEYFSTPGADQFQINYESAVYINADSYTITSL